VTYFPMTYNFMVNEFNAAYSYSKEKGLSVSADKKLKLDYKPSTKFTYEFDADDLRSKDLISSPYFKIEKPVGIDNYLFYENLSSQEFDGYMMNVAIDFYDKYGKYEFTEKFTSGMPYKYDVNSYSSSTHFKLFDHTTRIIVHVEFVPKSTAIMQTKLFKDQGITIQVVNSGAINKALLTADNMVYMSVHEGNCSNYRIRPNEDELSYAAMKAYGQFMHQDKRMHGMVYAYETGDKLELKSYDNALSKIHKYDEYSVLTLNGYSTLRGKTGSVASHMFSGQMLYLFDKDKVLKKIIVVRDMLK